MNHEDAGYIIEKAREILSTYVLCDACLGRLFAGLGRGLSNKERGRAIKIILSMEIHRALQEGRARVENIINSKLIYSLKELITSIIHREPEDFKNQIYDYHCYICNNKLDEYISYFTVESIKLLKELDASTYLIGASIPSEIMERENEISRRFSLIYTESIKSELKREVSKNIQLKSSYKPDFENPDVVLLIDLETMRIHPTINPLFIQGEYKKLARNISQSIWITRKGKKYPFSIEEALNAANNYYSSSRIVLHAAGREDVDVRMLGRGRPFVAEIKKPRKRRVSLDTVAKGINNKYKGLINISLATYTNRRSLKKYKDKIPFSKKIYKALVYTESPVTSDQISHLEEFFNKENGVVISQRTPLRVLHRRPDIIRKRKVYGVSIYPINKHVLEALIYADGGLYIKELINGDNGRTKPSFAEVLNTNTMCLKLDVLCIEKL